MTDFIADAMLGRLAVWLRLTGNDTVYSPDIDDEELLTKAENENRVLLTADSELHSLAKKKGVNSMLLREPVHERLARVFHVYEITPRVDPSKSRCSKCNGKLIEIDEKDKERIKGYVFEQTYSHYDRFWLCKDCNSVYFQGGYWSNIQRYMQGIREVMKEKFENGDSLIRQKVSTENTKD
ncbi:MAG: Mut7-C RNAse domain-containing protein [Promethearchaeia archaeon]